jgi:hypothetical protein
MLSDFSDELSAIEAALQAGGVHAALRVLNARVPHRFTGVYRFDGGTLRNVALFDRWAPHLAQGADAPMSETFCALVEKTDGPLEVTDGRKDDRFPWMQSNAVASYCGAPIRNIEGRAIGTLCHFDLEPCQATASEGPLLVQAASLFRRAVQGA